MGGRYGAEDILGVAVTARAVDGAATAAVCRAVADAFGLRARQVSLVSGATSRTKVIQLGGADPDDALETRLAARLAELLES